MIRWLHQDSSVRTDSVAVRELLLILTAAGHSHYLDAEALVALSRAMQSAAARLSESVRLQRLE
jgi:hypothetical protein